MNSAITVSKAFLLMAMTLNISGCMNSKNISSATQTTQSEIIACDFGYPNEPSNTIYFDFNSDKLNQAGIDQLNEIIKRLRLIEYKEIQILGNTDKNGSYSYNLLLGKNRANSVKNYFIANGINTEKLKVISHGEKYASKNTKPSAQYRSVVLLLVTN